MSWRSRASGALVCAASLAALPRAARAQGAHEGEALALAVASRPALYALGVGLAWRDDGRMRLVASLASGAYDDGRYGARADLAVHFLLNPWKEAGAAVYGGGGLSLAVGDKRGRTAPYALLVLGIEGAPGGRGGSFVEVGVGGGVRLAVGYRWRTRNAPGR